MNCVSKGKFPEFIVGGFQKCGTQSLRVNLNKHSQIKTPKSSEPGGEFNFFRVGSMNNTFNRGFRWYKSFFTEENIVYGDVSPNYGFESLENAKMIAKYIPDAKLIFTVRNPIDRAYSAYNHYLQVYPMSKNWGNWYPNKSFIENCEKGADFIGLDYNVTIKNYLEYFDKQNILIVFQENLKTQPQSELNKIFSFLGTPSEKIDSSIVHARTKPNLTIKDRQSVYKYFDKIVLDFYQYVGDDIFIWEDWDD